MHDPQATRHPAPEKKERLSACQPTHPKSRQNQSQAVVRRRLMVPLAYLALALAHVLALSRLPETSDIIKQEQQ